VELTMNLLTWSQQYLEEAIDDEIALADARHGMKVVRPAFITTITELQATRPSRTYFSSRNHPRTTSSMPLDKWRRSWNATGPLIGMLGLSVHVDDDEGVVSVGSGGRRRNVSEAYADHPGKDEAVVAAIVRAAIQVCNEKRNGA